jgi:hypothetical protein
MRSLHSQIQAKNFVMSLATKDKGLITLGLTVIGWGVYSIIQLVDKVNARSAAYPSKYPEWSDLSTSAMWFAVFMLAHAVSFLVLGPTARKLIPKKPQWTSEVWVAKLERFCSAIFQLGLSIGATMYLYRNLKESSWLPPSLGGSGSTTYCWSDGYPLQPAGESLRKFYLVFMGYTSAEMVGHIIRERNRPDFYELLVHLVVTNILLIFSYFGNLMRVGSLVMLAHSFSDIFVYFAKALVDTKITGGALSYIPLLVFYVWCRIYLHSAVIMRSIWLEAPVDVSNWQYLNFLLSVLLMLHMYWMFVIIKIGLFLLSTGQSRDLQASLSSLNVRQQIPHGAINNPSGKIPDNQASSVEDIKSVTREKKKANSARRR